MEVHGKKDEEISKLICLPCSTDGLIQPAYGFCQDCEEHLCETCYNHHKRARPSRKHVLLDKDSMPKIQSDVPASRDDITDFCRKHKDKPLEFYCNSHKSVACYVCVTLEHKLCQVDYIPDVSGNMANEISDIFHQIEALVRKCNASITTAETAVENLELTYTKVVENIKLFRNEINEYLDQIEAKIIREADEFVKDSKRKREQLKASCMELTKELNRSKSLMNTLSEENKLNNLFIEIKNAEIHLPILTKTEKEISQAIDIDDSIQLSLNTELLEKLKTVYSYEHLTITSAYRTVATQYIDTLKLKSQNDTKKCHITSLVSIAPSKKIIAVDSINKSIKLFDATKNVLVTEINVFSCPFDAICLPDNKIAVTIKDEKCIQIVSYREREEKLSLCQRIPVGEMCNGLAYCKDKLVVSCVEAQKIIILTETGETLKVLDFTALFNGPVRIVISNDEKFMYLCDTNIGRASKVVKIDFEGKVKDVFDQQDYVMPYGIIQLEDGTLLVCYRNSHTLLRLSNRFRKCKIVGLENEKLFYPNALSYSCRDQKLYVSCSSDIKEIRNDIVKVFDVKWD